VVNIRRRVGVQDFPACAAQLAADVEPSQHL
jgi:hypothetical protein